MCNNCTTSRLCYAYFVQVVKLCHLQLIYLLSVQVDKELPFTLSIKQATTPSWEEQR